MKLGEFRAFASITGALALFVSAAASAQLYKWVDSAGKVHYSDQPPPPEVKTQKVVPPAASADPSAVKGLAAKQADLRKAQAAENEKATKAQEAAQETVRRQDACNQARGRLRLIQQGGRVYRFDEKGEKQFLDDAGRQKAQQEAEQEVAQWCKPTA